VDHGRLLKKYCQKIAEKATASFREKPKGVIPAPDQVRGKLQQESMVLSSEKAGFPLKARPSLG
jgi:hypothetical protein